jgi:hypothetical protein
MNATAEPVRPQVAPAERSASSGLLLALASAWIVLAPYATVALKYRQALIVQAAIILAVVLVVLTVGLTSRGWLRRVRSTPGTLARGVALYAATAAVATVVGLARGNALTDVIGQALAMGLLPLAAVAALGLLGSAGSHAVAGGVFWAAAAATLLHWIHWARTLTAPGFNPRLFMANFVSPLGIALLASLLGLALAAASGRWRRAAALGGVFSLVAFIVVASTRSLWLVTPLTLVVFLALAGPARRRFTVRGVLGGIALAAAFGAIIALGATWWARGRVNLAPDPIRDASHWELPAGASLTIVPADDEVGATYTWRVPADALEITMTKPFPVGGRRRYRLQATVWVSQAERGGVTLCLIDDSGAEWARHALLTGPSSEEATLEQEFVAPAGVTLARLLATASAPIGGEVRVRDVRLQDLGPGLPWPLYRQWQSIRERTISLLAGPSEIARSQRTVSLRFAETRRLVELFGTADTPAQLVGHGLGARYTFEIGGIDDQGNLIAEHRPNYIHNFYAFLLYKTGVFGTLAVVAALSLWTVAAVRQARRASERWERLYGSAVAAALLAYALWSAACPEILDFRFAPLWGFALAGLSPVADR